MAISDVSQRETTPKVLAVDGHKDRVCVRRNDIVILRGRQVPKITWQSCLRSGGQKKCSSLNETFRDVSDSFEGLWKGLAFFERFGD